MHSFDHHSLFTTREVTRRSSFLNNGKTFASFQALGYWPSRNEVLIKLANGILVQWLMVIFWRNRYREEESTKFLLGARNKFRRGAMWNNNPGARDMWFNLPLHTSAWKRGWKSRRSFSCFVSRLKIKKYTEKRSCESLYYSSRYFRCWKLRDLDHSGIFHHILNMYYNLLNHKKKTVCNRSICFFLVLAFFSFLLFFLSISILNPSTTLLKA